MERPRDGRRMAVHRLVDRVVQDFPDEVMQPGGTDSTDVHSRTLADRLESFENGDVFCGVARGCHETPWSVYGGFHRLYRGHARPFRRSISSDRRFEGVHSDAPAADRPVYNDRLLKRALTFLICAAFAAAPRVYAGQPARTAEAPRPRGVIEVSRPLGTRAPGSG